MSLLNLLPEISITKRQAVLHHYETFGGSKGMLPSPDVGYELKLRVPAMSSSDAMTVRPQTEVFWRSRKIGRVVRASTAFENNFIICEFEIELNFYSTELEELFRNFDSSMIRYGNNGNTMSFQKPVDETRRIVRALRDQARAEGRLGPARYVEDEEAW